MRAALISFVAIAVTVVFQLTVVDRIAFPGGSGPDLVLLVVAALALATGPMGGVLTGFWGGLALDVAPPGSHFVGEDALVFCLIGYLCGLLAEQSSGDGAPDQGHTALFEILVTAVGAVCGETLLALLGVMLSDPRVTWPAITHVLPAAIGYDALLCPFVLYAVASALRLAGTRHQAERVAWSGRPARTVMPGAGQGAVRQVTAASSPRLRLGDRAKGTAALGAGSRSMARREPQIRRGLGAGRSPAAGMGAAFAGGQAKVRFGPRRHEGVLGGSLLGGSRAGNRGHLGMAGSGLTASRFNSSTLGRSLLGGSVFSRSHLGKPPAFGRAAPLGRSSPFRHRGNLAGLSGGSAGAVPRFSRGGPLTRLTGGRRRSAGPRSPGRGWLRGTSGGNVFSGRGTTSRGLTGGNGPGGRRMSGKAFGRSRSSKRATWAGKRTPALRTGRSGPARLHMPRPRAKRRWRTGGYR